MANTTTASIPDEVRQAINMALLLRPDDSYIFPNIGPIQKEDAAVSEQGVTSVKFIKPDYLGGLFTEASRRLSEDTDVSASSQSITETNVVLTTREYAGPHDGTGVVPLGIREFIKRRSTHDLIQWASTLLTRDRNRFLDRVFLDLLLSSTNVVTPDGSAEGALVADKVATVDWIRSVLKAMRDAKVPTYPDGYYRAVITTRDEMNLKKDPEFREHVRYLGQSNPVFPGHVGTIEGFHFAVSTHPPTKGVGAGGAVTGYQSMFFGPLGLGWGTALAPEVREDEVKDFGRKDRLIWIAEEAFGTLYPELLFRGITT